MLGTSPIHSWYPRQISLKKEFLLLLRSMTSNEDDLGAFGHFDELAGSDDVIHYIEEVFF